MGIYDPFYMYDPSDYDSGLPLTWKTWKSQGIWKRPLKVREFATEFQKSAKSQKILLSEIHFQPG